MTAPKIAILLVLVVGRRLAHPSCVDHQAIVAGGAVCSVCELLEPASSLDSSGRCGACQP